MCLFYSFKTKEANEGTLNPLYSLGRAHWLTEKEFHCSNSISYVLFALPGKHPNLAAFHGLEKDQSQRVNCRLSEAENQPAAGEGFSYSSGARNITSTPMHGVDLIRGSRAVDPAPQ